MPKVVKTNKPADWNALSAPTIKRIYFDTAETVELRDRLGETSDTLEREKLIEEIKVSRSYLEIRSLPYEVELEVRKQCTNWTELKNTGREEKIDDKGNKVAPNGMGQYSEVNEPLNLAAFVAAGIKNNDIIPGKTWAQKGEELLKTRSAKWLLSISVEIRKISQIDSGRVEDFLGL